MKNRTRANLRTLLLCVACLCLGSALTLVWLETQSGLPEAPQIEAVPPAAEGANTGDSQENEEEAPLELTGDPTLGAAEAPVEMLYVSEARLGYQDGDLRLLIPKLDVDIPVLNRTSAAVLRRGVGLYDYAQLPSEENGNVSIAGHRNSARGGQILDNQPFYYVNTLTEGDYLYLRDDQYIYQYQWQCTEVIEPTNWDPIRNQGYGCLTLTTCTPIGVADHRLMIRGELMKTIPLDEGYAYPVNTAAEQSG